MSRVIIVSRHPASVRWLMLNLTQVDAVWEQLDVGRLHPGDCLYGTLGVSDIASLSGLGVRYFHLRFALDRYLRVKALDDITLAALGPELIELVAIGSATKPPHLLAET